MLDELKAIVLVGAFAFLLAAMISIAWQTIQRTEFESYIDRVNSGVGFR